VLYYPDKQGKFTAIDGTRVTRVVSSNLGAFEKEKRIHSHRRLCESDYRALNRTMEEEYTGQDGPVLNVAFLDIEVAYDKVKGFANPSDPFNKITAISTYLSWLGRNITLVIKPDAMPQDRAEEIVAKFEDTILCASEHEMLDMWLELIGDTDVYSGWNSEGFDIPYITNRIIRVMGKEHTRRMCLWDQFPKLRKFEKFGKELETYDPIGRIHLDYLELYRKYNYHELPSYRLDYVGEVELGETKIHYEGTLDQLYNNDFEKFIAYNKQDTMLLVKLDAKLKFIELTNLIAHSNSVTLRGTLGAVAVTDQAVINEAHRLGQVVFDRPRSKDGEDNQAAGAYVAIPKVGMHEWIGSLDINSLYPSVIRALNMSPETIVGQVRQTRTIAGIDASKATGSKTPVADFWDGKFACFEYESVMNRDVGQSETIDWTDGTSTDMSSAQVYNYVFHSGQALMLSGNGTIFKYDTKGVIPGLLERWYAERKVLQKKAKEATTPEEFDFWDKRQLVKKINLNSAYGALLNPGSRFFDQRLGQSTTLCGRLIARHMAASVNELLTGVNDYYGDAIISGDTDSVYFSAYPIFMKEIDNGTMDWSKEKIIELYDAIGEQVNDTFSGFMNTAFNCPQSHGEIIKAGREMVASKGIFMAKKRYAVLIFDKEGKRKDKDGSTGELKAMGLDMKRADTPEFMQKFLEEVLLMSLEGQSVNVVMARVKVFREEFKIRPGWEKGTPKRVNNLTHHTAVYDKTGKCGVGHAMAAINWNRLRKAYSDNRSMDITDGQKTIVCKLRNNPLQITSIGYPIDEMNLPDWFKQQPFDHGRMEETIIDSKIMNLFAVLNWDLNLSKDQGFLNDIFS